MQLKIGDYVFMPSVLPSRWGFVPKYIDEVDVPLYLVMTKAESILKENGIKCAWEQHIIQFETDDDEHMALMMFGDI